MIPTATDLLYYTDPSVNGTATVQSLGRFENADYVVLDRTIFHPAGGGQKSDVGTIGGARVVRAEKLEDMVFHYLETPASFASGTPVPLEVAAEPRLLNTRYHTAGHLVGSVIEEILGCKAIGGQHWAGEAFMRFERDAAPDPAEVARCLDAINAAVREDRPITIRMDGVTRFVTIEGWDAVPCGGTHLQSTALIGPVELGVPKVKQRRLQISYRLGDAGSTP